MKLNVLIVTGTFPSISETFIVNQVIYLIKSGYLVSIYSYNKGDLNNLHGNIGDNRLLEKTTFHKIMPASRKLRLVELGKWIIFNFSKIKWERFIKVLIKKESLKRESFLELFYESRFFLLKNSNYDLIHAHFGSVAKRIAVLKGHDVIDVKLISTFHGADLVPKFISKYRVEYEELFAFSDAITVNTIYTRDLLGKVSTNLNNLYILPVGLDTQFFKSNHNLKRRTSNDFTILFCGRLISLKAPDKALRIFKKVMTESSLSVKLNIIGIGPMLENLKLLSEELELSKHINFLGALKIEEVRDQMNNADLLLMPGTYDQFERAETQGLVIQEAQAMNLPVIVSDAGGMKYGLIDGKTGYVCTENKIEDFKNKIIYLLENKEVRKLMGEKGRVFVIENYDSEILGVKLRNIYKKVIE